MPTKPILVMTGDYGSGKSTLQRVVGKLLFGDDWNVSTIQGERDFDTSVVNKYYLVYDNLDIIKNDWIRNKIASLSTGYKVEVRKMYSNMEMFQANPIAYLALNSMSQSVYQRPDIASRLLIFRTKQFPGDVIPPHIIDADIHEFRNLILSEVLDNLCKIIKYVDNKFAYKGKFRMADFANVGYKIASAFGREYEFSHILDIMTADQRALPLEDSPLVELLDKWLATRNTFLEVSTGELYGQLKSLSETAKLFFPFKSSISFGKILQTSLANLKLYFDIEARKGSNNKVEWRISNKSKENDDA